MRAVISVTLLVTSAAVLRSAEPSKKRIAVLNFENAAVQSGPVMPFYQPAPVNVGKAVADLLVNRLVSSGSCIVIERAAIEQILLEQNLSNSDRFDPQTAAKIGRLLGVDAIVLGTITKYDRDDKTTGSSRSRSPFAGAGASMKLKHDVKASVEISARIVSPDTAEIVAVAQGTGASERKGVKTDIRDRPAIMFGQGGPSGEVLNEALDKAITQLTAHVEETFPKIPSRAGKLEGLVADANESGRLILNVGSRAGAKPGDHLQVWRAGKPIRDPETGKVLRYDDTLLGDATITSVDEVSAVASYAGAELPKPGDRVKTK
jgi:curli biogenesis system outer membrane secretion channel CsgG